MTHILPPGARNRFAVLGASNVTRGLIPLIDSLRRIATGTPFDLYAAAGHGRSYGLESRFLVRGLPSILEAGIWSALGAAGAESNPSTESTDLCPPDPCPADPCLALLTDVGNDLIYGATAEQTAAWVASALERLPSGSRAVVTLPPVERLRRLSPALLGAFRRLFFPGRSRPIAALVEQAIELSERLAKVSTSRFPNLDQCLVVEPQDAWYFIDPIHVARSSRSAAFDQLLAGLCDGAGCGVGKQTKGGERTVSRGLSAGDRLALLLARPERWTLAGRSRERAQPAVTLDDGSRIWLF